ncbi:MAG: hypothetical protein ACFFCS_27175 [Candidatus Hodarchaeota archaeon]
MNGINGVILLSHFDVIEGPSIIYSIPNLKKEDMTRFETIPKLIDMVNDENCFLNSIDNLYSLNYFFRIQNRFVRGSWNLLLLSVVIDMKVQDAREEEILLFLQDNEVKLKYFVEVIKEEEKFENGGIFAGKNEEELFAYLHELYREFFTSKSIEIILKEESEKIVVFGPIFRNPYHILNLFKKKLNFSDDTNLKRKLVVQALEEVEFLPFECQARQTPLCEGDKCPACEFLANESKGAIFIFEEENFGSEEDFKDLRDYILNLGTVETLPILIIKIQEEGNKSLDNAGTLKVSSRM